MKLFQDGNTIAHYFRFVKMKREICIFYVKKQQKGYKILFWMVYFVQNAKAKKVLAKKRKMRYNGLEGVSYERIALRLF